MVELVDTLVLGTSFARSESSSLSEGTQTNTVFMLCVRLYFIGGLAELVYCDSLENYRSLKRSVGSNPTASAKSNEV